MPTDSLLTRIPTPVFARSTAGGVRTFQPSGGGYDFAIGGMPFNGAASEQRPVIRQSAPVQKDQTDVSREPGEHTLAFWWLRAQSSFHGGAGQKYLGSADTDSEGLSRYRYATSEGVDVFTTPGRVSPLTGTHRLLASPGTPLLSASDGGTLFVADGTSLTRHFMYPTGTQPERPSSSMTMSFSTVAWGGTEAILSLTSNGSTYFVATATGVYRGESVGAATKMYDLPAGSTPLLRFVKQRLILATTHPSSLPVVYELDADAAAGTALPAAIFSACTGYWNWAAIAESPDAILVAGDNGATSSVYKMTLDTSGPVPLLSPGVVVAELPPGELVTGMTTYLGTVLGLQTTAGFRVGVLGSQGDFQYGGLLFTHEWGQGGTGVIGVGDSLYAAWTDAAGVAGLARVDLTGTFGSGQSLRFPWAPDVQAQTVLASVDTAVVGRVTDVALWDFQRKVFVVPGDGVYVDYSGVPVTSRLTTSRIRWDTLEPKLIRFARLRGDGDQGRVTLEVARDSDTAFFSVGSIDLSRQSDSGDLYVQMPPCQYVVLRITLTGGASFSGFQIKALPAQRKQRLLQIPLYCFDREADGTGQIIGNDGDAMRRLLALEQMEQAGETVSLQWLSVYPEQELTEYVVIEQIEFQQGSGPSDQRGWGGIITLTLRTVE